MYGDDFDDHGHDGHFPAAALGAGAAMLGYQLDRQTEQLLNAQGQPININVQVNTGDEDPKGIAPVNNLDFTTAAMPKTWKDFIGQNEMKRDLEVDIAAALQLGEAFPHTLFASGFAGVGKTTIARLLKEILGVWMIEMVPPFNNLYTLADAAQQLMDHDILFIDEIHKLCDNGKKGSEFLLKLLEDKTLYLPDGTVIPLNDITIFGATTDPGMLPDTVLDRFENKPYFEEYTIWELAAIAIDFAWRTGALDFVSEDMAIAFAKACGGTPRALKTMVRKARNLAVVGGGEPATAEQVLNLLRVTADGMSRTHVAYLTKMFLQQRKEGRNGIEYCAGQVTMMSTLRETKPGIGRVERYLVEQGLLVHTPQGRKLTPSGILRAMEFIAEEKGASDVA